MKPRGQTSVLHTVRIEENSLVVETGCYRMVLKVDPSFTAQPGQFLQVAVVSKSTDPLLRRPFSIARLQKEHLFLFYQVKGKGTALLSKLPKGETISILGPLGNHYPLQTGPKILVAGGLGAASLFFLAQKLSLKNETICVMLGAKNKKDLFLTNDFKRLGLPVLSATEDGSVGFRGLVTQLLEKEAQKWPVKTTVYACGPNEMLAETFTITQKYGWKAYFSLETMMACGFGLCRGCVIPTINGYRLACADGPVFEANQISWQEMV